MGYSHKGNDLYWKIGLAIDDVDAASKCLGCSPGSQFLDIGFLTHLADPAGPLAKLRVSFFIGSGSVGTPCFGMCFFALSSSFYICLDRFWIS